MATLPPPRHLLTSLITSLSHSNIIATGGNPLKDAPEETRKALLTLHVLFPNELLPAFDLLDRGLVTRFVQRNAARDQTRRPPAIVHYVRSAQQQQQQSRRHHHHHHSPPTTYEVRLSSWTCSCPAFAFAAFPAENREPDPSTPPPQAKEDSSSDWIFGGLTLGTDIPVCKHLLACALVEQSDLFKSFAVEQEVSVEELAGWAAGWGD